VAVHGIHLLLWALDQLAAEWSLHGFIRMRVHFDRGVRVGDEVSLSWQEQNGRLVARLTGETGTLVRINLLPGDDAVDVWVGPVAVPALPCENLDMAALVGRSGELVLALPQWWMKLFPHLAATFSPRSVAALLATTRLVGMACPGLHSIFSALQFESDMGAMPDASLRYEVFRADPRVRLVDMAISGAGLRGTVSTFLRPAPYAQPALVALRHVIAANAFAGQRALVIGGSRGLGELAAKLLTAGGAAVTITWRQGSAEAHAIAAEAAALGLTIQVMPFDVAVPPEDASPVFPYTHLYYFATPRISPGRPGHFEPAVFAEMLDVYAIGFARCAAWFVARSVPRAFIWYPSTIFVEQPDPQFGEYTAAKACGEALCTQLNAQLAPRRTIVQRLPRLPTDQTQALAEVQIADGVAILRAALLRCALEP
jgi:hypothetical protein